MNKILGHDLLTDEAYYPDFVSLDKPLHEHPLIEFIEENDEDSERIKELFSNASKHQKIWYLKHQLIRMFTRKGNN